LETFLIRQHKFLLQKDLKYIDPEARNLSLGLKYNTETTELACKPAKGRYTVGTVYTNGQQRLTTSVVPLDTLESLWGTEKRKFRTTDFAEGIPENSTYAFQVMYTLNMWNTTTNITQITYYNISSFSSRPRLIIPYAISLLATLPFPFLGFRSLRLNGIPAVDGGFIQPQVTPATSSKFRDMAAKGSDRPNDVPKSVKAARIQYGYLEEHETGSMREGAGFGLEDEIAGGEHDVSTRLEAA
jgi:hypothetical protein